MPAVPPAFPGARHEHDPAAGHRADRALGGPPGALRSSARSRSWASIAVFLLYGIFAENPLLQWEMWAGLAAGILTVLFLAGGAAGGRRRRSGGAASRAAAQRARLRRRANEPTGEI